MLSRRLIFKPMCHVYMGWGLCWNKKSNLEIGKLFRLEGDFCLKLKHGMPQWNLKYFPLPGCEKSVQISSKCQNFRFWLTTNRGFQCYETIHSMTSKISDFKYWRWKSIIWTLKSNGCQERGLKKQMLCHKHLFTKQQKRMKLTRLRNCFIIQIPLLDYEIFFNFYSVKTIRILHNNVTLYPDIETSNIAISADSSRYSVLDQPKLDRWLGFLRAQPLSQLQAMLGWNADA